MSDRGHSYRPSLRQEASPLDVPGEQTRRLRALATDLARYDKASALASIAALQLRPENADQMIRLETLAFAAAAGCTQGSGKALLRTKLLSLLNDEPVRAFARLEDPCENLVTEEITFEGHGFTYFPGILDSPNYYNRIFLEMCQHLRTRRPELGYQATRIMLAALAIGDAVARRAGMPRGIPPEEAHWQKVVVPPDAQLAKLAQQVRLSQAELEAILGSFSLSLADLTPLVLEETPAWEEYEEEKGLLRRPIVRVGLEFVVAIPSALTYAARDAVLHLAYDAKAVGDVADILLGITIRQVLEDVQGLGFEFKGTVDIATTCGKVLAGRFAFDTDKEAVVILLHDPLDDYAPDSRDWDADQIVDEVNKQLPSIEDGILDGEDPPARLLFLFVSAGVHRRTVHHWKLDRKRRLSEGLELHADQLNIIAHIDAGDPIALWAFASTRGASREQRLLITVDVLAEYALFRLPNRVHVHDNIAYGAIVPVPHELRGRMQRKSLLIQDRHAVRHPSGKAVEVRRVYKESIQNVYAIADGTPRLDRIVVDRRPKPIWLFAGDDADGAPPLIANGLTTSLATWLNDAPARLDNVMALTPRESVSLVLSCTNEGPAVAARRLAPDAIELVVGRALIHQAFSDPTAENAVLHSALEAIAELAGVEKGSVGPIARETLERTSSRLFVALPLASAGVRPGLPDGRVLRPYAIDAILDEFARRAYASGEKPRPLSDQEILPAFDAIEQELFRKLDQNMRELSPLSVDAFVFYYDCILNAINKRWISLPFTVARGNADGADYVEDADSLNQSATAARFLIEYATAQPPTGTRAPSLAAYDELLAIAFLIIEHRNKRDLLAHGSARVRGEVAPSLRRVFTLIDYHLAQAPVREDMHEQELESATDLVNAPLPSESPAYPEGFAELEAAATAEWGASFIEIGRFCDEIVLMAESALGVRAEQEFIRELAQRLEWPAERTRQIAAQFTLEPREKFLTTHETQPWRFGRRLSYMMRPLLRSHRDGEAVITWGPLHVTLFPDYLLHQVLNLRIQGRSPLMKSYLGRRRAELVEFNNAVSNKFDAHADWKATPSVVIRSVFGRVSDDPEELSKLGDIDTLALHFPTRTAYIIEAKSLLVARTPAEISNEIAKLFDDEEGAVPVNQARVAWLNTNIDRLKEKYKLEGGWRTVGLVVVDRPLIGIGLRRSPMPILSISELEQGIPTGKLRKQNRQDSQSPH